MSQFPDNLAFAEQTLPVATYDVLRRSLLDTAHQSQGLAMTEAEWAASVTANWPWSEWALVVTPTAQGVLVKSLQVKGSDHCVVGLLTEPQGVGAFIEHLLSANITAAVRRRLSQTYAQLRDRAPTSCSDLILQLLPYCLSAQSAAAETAPSVQSQPAQIALDQQQEQGLLLNQVVTKIRQSLDLSVILSTTVEEVRQFLEADRLLIYQFQHNLTPSSAEGTDISVESALPSTARGSVQSSPSPAGYITYESLSSSQVGSVINFTEGYCFDEYSRCREHYLTGHPVAVDDVQTRYRDSPCLLNFLQKAQVQSKLIAPIVMNGRLWGLLIAHQCYESRQWQRRELMFLQHIAEHLAIAVQQAELYQQLQQQTQSLEACVVNRTQDLWDALAAAQSASRAKSEFLATMSHELRTPLTCIIGMSATLLRWSFGELSPRQRNYLTTIHQSGERLLALINDILEMSKIEAGRTVLEVRSFSLISLVQQTLEPYRRQARDRDIKLHCESTLLADQDTFTGDPRRIQQILENLLSNALKFTDNGGSVSLRIRRENHVAVFQVEDTGIGIPKAQLPLLFEKFQQLETSRQRQYQGTGLGLALTKQLVELHGGTIHVNSREGVGSVFTVRLPLQRLGDRSSHVVLPEDPADSAPIIGRIVLVEDHEDTAGIICDLLTAADYQVIWVIEGSRVVEQVALLQPAVVIINMQLSGIDGRRIIRALRDSLVTSSVKILAMRSLDNSHEFPQADGTIALPLDPERLLESVNALAATAMV